MKFHIRLRAFPANRSAGKPHESFYVPVSFAYRMLFIRLRLAQRRRDVFCFVSVQPSLFGIMHLPAFPRAIDRRHSAVNDRFSALQAVTRIAGLFAGFHGEIPKDHGFEPRSAAITHGPHGWRS